MVSVDTQQMHEPTRGGQCLEVDTDMLLGPELHNYGFSLYGPVVYMYIVFH